MYVTYRGHMTLYEVHQSTVIFLHVNCKDFYSPNKDTALAKSPPHDSSKGCRGGKEEAAGPSRGRTFEDAKPQNKSQIF